MKTTGFTRLIYGLLILAGVVLVGGMIYIGIQMVRLPQPQQVTDAYLDQIQSADWQAAQQMHAAPEGFQRARADWQALFAEKGSLQGRSVRSFDILYGISFSAEGIGGTSVTAVYNLDLESGRARLALDLQPDWQSWKISNLEIQY